MKERETYIARRENYVERSRVFVQPALDDGTDGIKRHADVHTRKSYRRAIKCRGIYFAPMRDAPPV